MLVEGPMRKIVNGIMRSQKCGHQGANISFSSGFPTAGIACSAVQSPYHVSMVDVTQLRDMRVYIASTCARVAIEASLEHRRAGALGRGSLAVGYEERLPQRHPRGKLTV